MTLTATVYAIPSGAGTPAGSVDFFDTTTNTDLGTRRSRAESLRSAPRSCPGNQLITVSYAASTGFTGSMNTVVVVIRPAIYVLNATASGALNLSGSARLDTPGRVVVDSRSSNALVASSSAQIDALQIVVTGGVLVSKKTLLSPTPTTKVTATADPLAWLLRRRAARPAGRSTSARDR